MYHVSGTWWARGSTTTAAGTRWRPATGGRPAPWCPENSTGQIYVQIFFQYFRYFVKVFRYEHNLCVFKIFRDPEEEWLRGFPKLRLCHGLPSLQLPARALPRGLGPLPLPQQDGRGGCTLSTQRPPASDPITVKNWALRILLIYFCDPLTVPNTYAYDINILNECETEDISIVCTILTYLQ